MILVVFGLPGSGKTTVAKILCKELNAVHLNTDELRKKSLAELGYSERSKRRIYETMFSIAEEILQKEKNVCLDGTFYKKSLREKAKRLAKKLNKKIFFIEVKCEEETIAERLEKRDFSKEFSEADFRVYKIVKAQFEPMKKKHISIDTTNADKIYENCIDIANRIRVELQYNNIIKPLIKKYNAELKQTHISFILLTKKFAYKVKKAVKLSFLDFSSLTKRKKFCELEIKLNSIASPEIYFGLVGIKNGVFAKKLKNVEEYAVKMKRLKEKNLLINLILERKIDKKLIKKIARKIADFHKKVKTCKISAKEHIKLIKHGFANCFGIKRIVEKFGYLEKLERIENKVNEFLQRNKKLFAFRAKNGFIKECHGDLKAKNIFVENNKIYFFDCIEFDKKLRLCDVVAEIAFLAVDLDFYGFEKLSKEFISEYLKITNDILGKELVGFYKCYRACVNALVEAYSLENPEIKAKEKKKHIERCKKYLDIALDYIGA